MSARLIDGKALAQRLHEQTRVRVARLASAGRTPLLVSLHIGEAPEAMSFASAQRKGAATVGIEYRQEMLRADTDQRSALEAVDRLNRDDAVSGLVLQMPVPPGLDAFALQQRIAVAKDVEGVSAASLGLLMMGRAKWAPCTAAAAFACVEESGIQIAGRRAAVVGRSVIVGKPVAQLLLSAHATVTQCHSRTVDLAGQTRRADILVVAAGVRGLIGAEHISPGAVVIDVGTHRVSGTNERGEPTTVTCGDVRFEEVVQIAAAITPVPGGVGPVTVAMLLANTVSACEDPA